MNHHLSHTGFQIGSIPLNGCRSMKRASLTEMQFSLGLLARRYVGSTRGCRINSKMRLITGERYCGELLVITFLSERGLAFRRDNETLGSVHNGNYLGILELLGKFDPFLDEHLKKYRNKGDLTI